VSASSSAGGLTPPGAPSMCDPCASGNGPKKPGLLLTGVRAGRAPMRVRDA
jgi:hypothetical protein